MTLALAEAVERWPDRTALTDGEVSLTYSELGRRCAALAYALRGLDARGPHARPVALVVHHELSTVVAIHTLIAAGAPLLPLHPRLAPPEKARLLELARPSRVLDLRETPDLLAGEAAGCDLPPTLPDDERPLALLSTSGSSGAPRLIVLSRRAFAASAAANQERLPWREGDRWLASLPLYHVGGLSVLTRCLDAGRCAVLTSPGDTEGLIRGIDTGRATLASLVPTQLGRLLHRSPEYQPPEWLRVLLVGGARTPEQLLAQAADRGWPVLTSYGMTEACSQIATQRPGTINRGGLGVGPPLSGTEVRIRDGVIELRSPTLLSARLPPGAPPLADDGWFRTEDLGTLDEAGNLHVLGRTSELIISGGENVAPAEVERALERCPGVLEACAFGVPDPIWGEMVAVAFVGSASASALSATLRAELVPYKWARAAAALPELPRRPSGKPDRAATAALALPKLQPITYD